MLGGKHHKGQYFKEHSSNLLVVPKENSVSEGTPDLVQILLQEFNKDIPEFNNVIPEEVLAEFPHLRNIQHRTILCLKQTY